MDRQHGRADTRSELRAPLDPGSRLLVEAVDANEGAARPGDRRLGGDDKAGGGLPSCLCSPRERSVVGDVLGHQRDLDPLPVAAV